MKNIYFIIKKIIIKLNNTQQNQMFDLLMYLYSYLLVWLLNRFFFFKFVNFFFIQFVGNFFWKESYYAFKDMLSHACGSFYPENIMAFWSR